jgi:two-component system chemotaxis sensor kinase CheA
MDDKEVVQEFLLESAENMARLDQEMVQLEQQPGNGELLASIFRTIHTIKGTCGFLGFTRLGALTHVAEGLLSDLRNGTRTLDADLTSLILETVDTTRRILGAIEAGEGEGPVFELDLISRLEQAQNLKGGAVQRASAISQAQRDASRVELVTTTSCGGSMAGCPNRMNTGGDSTLRVDVGLLDRLMNLVGELVLTRNQLTQHNTARENATLNAVAQRLNLITSELQEGVMKTRMQPIGVVWNKLPRVVRDLAASLKKQIALEMEGAGTELDRTIIEAIRDPLTHIVRNSCDHGIEPPSVRTARGKTASGCLKLRAWHEGGQVNIEISDDGAGIDTERVKAKALERRLITDEQAARLSEREAVNLVFLPGFSTAETVTSISGRGVGMDVVRTHIERIGGTVDLTSKLGQGTMVRVRIPLTLAIIPGLVVQAGGERFVIPQMNLEELVQLGESAAGIEYVHATPVLRRRNALVPVADLCAVLGLTPERRPGDALIVILQADQRRFGLIVDAICDNQEIVVKPMGQQLKPLNCYAGATIMGDGRIALILDVHGLAARAGLGAVSGRARAAVAPAVRLDTAQTERQMLLLFRAGEFAHLAVPLARVARLEKIGAALVERASGRPVVQYRGKILPLLNLAQLLDGREAWDGESLQVVVFRTGATELGLVVDEITDIVEDSVADARGSGRQALLGTATIAGKVTDLVDLDSVAETAWTETGSLARMAAALTMAQGAEERRKVVP